MSKDSCEIFTTCGTKLLIDKEDCHLFNDVNISLGVNKLYGMYRDREGKLKYVHREVMAARKNEQIDHINMNTFDNRKINLRVATRSQNRANQKKNVYKDRESTSIYKGVCFDKENNNWLCRVNYQGKVLFTGRFKNEISAALAYNHHAEKVFGEFSRLNKIPSDYSDTDWRKFHLPRTVGEIQSGYSYVGSKSGKNWTVSITINGKQRKVGTYTNIIDAVLSANENVIKNNLHMLDKYPKKIQILNDIDLANITDDQLYVYNKQLKELSKGEENKNEKTISFK